MKSFLTIIFIIMISLNSCRNCDCEKNYNKLDNYSQMELKNLKNADNTAYVSVVALAEQNLTQEQIISIKKMDVLEFQLIGKTITFRANYQTIEKILELDYIKSIEVNKTKQTN